MGYKCINCGIRLSYDEIAANGVQCVVCKEHRSNIWIKERPDGITKTILAR